MLPIQLAVTTPADLPTLFEFQRDPAAMYLAAFTPQDPTDKAAYLAKYTPFLTDPTITMRTIWLDGRLAGSIAKFLAGPDAELTYWIDRQLWGQGVATAALTAFLRLEPTRPLFARVAFDNLGSQKVLERCGFVCTGQDRGFANARQAEIEDYVYQLSA